MLGGQWRGLTLVAGATALLTSAGIGGCSTEPPLGTGSTGGAGGACADYVTADGFHCCCGNATCSRLPCAAYPDGLGGVPRGGTEGESGAGSGGATGSTGGARSGGRDGGGGVAPASGGATAGAGGAGLPPQCEGGRCAEDACPPVLIESCRLRFPLCPVTPDFHLPGCCLENGHCGGLIGGGPRAGCHDHATLATLVPSGGRLLPPAPWPPCGPTSLPDASPPDGTDAGRDDAGGTAPRDASAGDR